MKKKTHLKLFNIVVAFTTLLTGGILLHDLIIWAVIPIFTGNFIALTYTGLFIDLFCLFGLDISTQYLSEIFK